jgi:hypothetical protein
LISGTTKNPAQALRRTQFSTFNFLSKRFARDASTELSRAPYRRLERDDSSSIRHPALHYWWSIIFSENRYPLFGIML